MAIVPCQGPGVRLVAVSGRVEGQVGCPRGSRFDRVGCGHDAGQEPLAGQAQERGPASTRPAPRTSFKQGACGRHTTGSGHRVGTQDAGVGVAEQEYMTKQHKHGRRGAWLIVPWF